MNKEFNYPIYPLFRSKIGKFSLEKREYRWESLQTEPDQDNPEAWLQEKNRMTPEFLEKFNTFYKKILKNNTFDPSKFKVVWVGQSHLDIAWEWRIHQTIQKAAVTYKKAIFHIEHHPSFTFAASQPLTLEYIRQTEPDLFKQIQKYVQENRFELVGGMWVEPDARMPSGESFVRQRLYGQYYYFEHFSKFSEVEWLPDTFGYAFSLPQIIAKSGGKYFFTTKIWGGHPPFEAPWPFVNFLWKSPDGSELLCHVAPQMFGPIESWEEIKSRSLVLKSHPKTGYNYSIDHDPITNNEFDQEIVPLLPVFYGLGDGGHGPTGEEVAIVDGMLKKGIGSYSLVHAFFKELEQYKTKLPIWNDELYFQRHWGTLTTQAFIKRALRYLEWRNAALENVCTLIELGGGSPTPKYTFETIWKDICTNQFHDILPGSSIAEVYDDVYDMLFQDFRWLQRIEKWCIEHLAYGKEYNDFIGGITDMDIPVIIINPTPYSVKEIVSISLTSDDTSEESDRFEAGQEFELYENNISNSNEKIIKNETKTKLYIKKVSISENMARNIKSIRFQNGKISYAQFIESDPTNIDYFMRRPARIEFLAELGPYEVRYATLGEEPAKMEYPLKVMEDEKNISILNEWNTISISKASGTISRWSFKNHGKEYRVLESGSAKLVVYGDMGDVWDFSDDYRENPIDADQDSIKVKIEEKGPLRIKISAEMNFEDLNSKFIVNYILYQEMESLSIETLFFPQDPSITVKMEYYLGFNSDYSEAEIPFGIIKRPMIPKSRYERCREELNAQTFIRFKSNDGTIGLALINEGKYGFSTHDNKVHLTLLRTARYPKVASEAWCLEQRRKRIQQNEKIPATSDQHPHLCLQKLVPYITPEEELKIYEIAHAFNIKSFAEILTPMNIKKIPKFRFSNLVSQLNPELEIIAIKRPYRLSGIQEKAAILRISNMSDKIIEGRIQLDPYFHCIRVEKCNLLEKTDQFSGHHTHSYNSAEGVIQDIFNPFEVNTYIIHLN